MAPRAPPPGRRRRRLHRSSVGARSGQALRDLALPDGTAVTLVVRGGRVVVPRGATVLRPGDHVFVALRSDLRPLLDRLFDPDAETPPPAPGLAVEFAGAATLGQLHRFFGLPGPTWSERLLASVAADDAPRVGPFLLAPGSEPDLIRLTLTPEPVPEPTPDSPAEPSEEADVEGGPVADEAPAVEGPAGRPRPDVESET